MVTIALLALVSPQNDILMCLRRADTIDFPDLWELPGGGVDQGETPQQAAARECFEELQIKVMPEKCQLFGVYPGNHRDKPIELHVFYSRVGRDISPVFGEGQQAWRWMNIVDIWDYPHIPGNKSVLADLFAKIHLLY